MIVGKILFFPNLTCLNDTMYDKCFITDYYRECGFLFSRCYKPLELLVGNFEVMVNQ